MTPQRDTTMEPPRERPAGERAPHVVFEDGAAVFRGYAPAPALRGRVELLWTTAGVPFVNEERVLPNGAVELIFNFGGPQRVLQGGGRFERYRRVWLAGLQRGPLDIGSEEDSHLLGVRFLPGGAAGLLAGPAEVVTDDVVEASELGSPFLLELWEQLAALDTTDERLDLLEGRLAARLLAARGVDARVKRALLVMAAAPAGLGCRRLADDVGVTHKHLIVLFRRDVGLPPKTLQRILRFQAVLRALEGRGPPPPFAALAHAIGYADQAHMIHDFKAFTGVTPRTYLAARTVDPNHLDLAST